MTRAKPSPPAPPTIDAPPAPAPWDERHRQEARVLLRRLSLAAEIAGDEHDAYVWGIRAEGAIRSEARLCDLLEGPGLPYLDAAEIRRKVRRVRDLAEGWAVRETTWHVRTVAGLLTGTDGTRGDAERVRSCYSEASQARLVRVTRIRRTPR